MERRLAEKQAVDAELTRARTQLVRLRSERDQITIGLRRGQLLQKHAAKLQLGFLLTGLRQRMMAFSYSLPPLLVNRSEHEIGRIIDQEVRAALRDFASWPQRMADPSWAENIDEDLVPPPEGAVNGVDVDGGAARLERKNATRREKYAAKAKGQ